MKKAHNRIEMVGKQYNSWVVLQFIETVNKISFYSAKCTECGQVFRVDGRNLRSGASKRCVQCGLNHTKQANIGKIKARTTPEKMKLKYLYKNKKKNAIRNGHAWDLGKKAFKKLVFANCTYCGIEPSTTVNILKNQALHSYWVDNGFITYNGIDRVDSSKHYTEDNCVTACWKCNNSKNNLSVEAFEAWVTRVYNHLQAAKHLNRTNNPLK